MLDTDDEIREIKKEIIESRGLVIKTNNLVNSLAADVKSIAKRQVGYERRFNWNSATAYVLFATLCFGGLYLASDARIREIRSEQEELTQQVKELTKSLTEETERGQARARAETRAAKFYELIRAKRRREVVEGFDQLQRESLSKAEDAFFRDMVDKFRLDLSVEAFQEGLEMMRTGRYAEAADKFEKSVEFKEDGAQVPTVKYNLARAYLKLDRSAEAMVLAQAVIDQNGDKEIQDDATMLLSECAANLGNIDDARNALRNLLRKWPRSEFVTDARRKLSELNLRALRGKLPAPAGAAPAAAPTAAPAAAAAPK